MIMMLAKRSLSHNSFISQGTKTRNFSALVSNDWLASRLHKDEFVLPIDCDHPIAFQRGHIQRALPFPFATTGLKDSTPRSTGLVSTAEFREAVQMIQLPRDATLVFYDNDSSLKATRAWWVFRHFGFPKDQLKVLDGGWKKWITAGCKISTGNPFPPPQSGDLFQPFKPSASEFLVGLPEVQAALADGNTHFIDTRSEAEYTGANSAGNRRRGRVPGAHHFDWTSAVDETGAFRSKAELTKNVVEAFDLNKQNPAITYCQRGIRAAHVAFVLEEVLGFDKVQVYEDSMMEYLNQPDTDVES